MKAEVLMKSKTLKELAAYLAEEAARLEKIERAEIEWTRDAEYSDVFWASFRNVRIRLAFVSGALPAAAGGAIRISTVDGKGEVNVVADISLGITKREWLLDNAKRDLIALAHVLRPLIEPTP